MQKVKKAVEVFRSTKLQLEHLMAQPFAALTKQEMIMRKLMRKYHDDPDILKRKLKESATGFDPNAAERFLSLSLSVSLYLCFCFSVSPSLFLPVLLSVSVSLCLCLSDSVAGRRRA